ncbi:ABC transporter ATP-binding protein [Amycolatopsis thermophila]|uniref:NitT/TauT family transport system ATP-binding protein n=1 Tax=Amycolatopsis thermophila TaxID=206084 RepID=A0ABU0F5J6_9PSEU|nr:ABC transporter ATP-binding protein [Amycolatopsis thermophila]MDQ0382860.1 NitT/TauT family transport system ATP-binding protein [Amycolatopsis thermophila]
MTTPLLDVSGLNKSYGSKQVLADVGFTAGTGDFLTVVGPSGAGKTTLLRCVSGLLTPDRGAVALSGSAVTGPPEDLALVFQDYSRSLLPWMTVRGNIGLPLRSKGIRAPERRRRADQALASVGLADAGPLYPWQLSGGMQQRVAIARALAFSPRILVMDEPFASVDAQTRAELEDLVLGLRDRLDITFLLVTHDIDEAVYLADRVVVLSGAPTTVTAVVPVDLGRDRDQVETKATSKFVDLRSQVYRLIRSEKAAA